MKGQRDASEGGGERSGAGVGDAPDATEAGGWEPVPLRRAWRFLTRPRGNRMWDVVIRGTGIVGGAAIPVVLLFPATAPPIAFVLLTAWLNGPLSPVMPTAYEPVLMIMARVYPAPVVAGLGCVGVALIEFVTYQLYRKVLGLDTLRKVRESDLSRKLVGWFRKAPFATVWFVALTPLPFWVVQILSPLAGYPVVRHLAATVLGRFPRYWLFAELAGWLRPSTELLLAIAVGGFVVAVTAVLIRRWRGRGEEPDEAGAEPGRPAEEPA